MVTTFWGQKRRNPGSSPLPSTVSDLWSLITIQGEKTRPTIKNSCTRKGSLKELSPPNCLMLRKNIKTSREILTMLWWMRRVQPSVSCFTTFNLTRLKNHCEYTAGEQLEKRFSERRKVGKSMKQKQKTVVVVDFAYHLTETGLRILTGTFLFVNCQWYTAVQVRAELWANLN